MSYDTITLTTDHTTLAGMTWPAGTLLELEQKLRRGWQVGYKTPDGRVGTASIPRDELPPEVSQALQN